MLLLDVSRNTTLLVVSHAFVRRAHVCNTLAGRPFAGIVGGSAHLLLDPLKAGTLRL